VVDCNFHDFTGYSGNTGIWCELGSHFALLGTNILNCQQIEHVVRTQGEHHSLYQHNFLSQPGMMGANHSYGADKQTIALRGSSIAGSTAWTGIWTELCIVSDNVIDGGPLGTGQAVQIASQASSHDERHRDIIVERNLFTGNIGQCITASGERITVRNNLAKGAIISLFEVAFDTRTLTPPPVDNKCYNNSVYSTSTKFSFAIVHKNYTTLAAGTPTGTVVVNNLAYAPSATQDAYNNAVKMIVVAALTPVDMPVVTVSNTTSDVQLTGATPGFTVPPTPTLTTFKPTSGYGVNTGTYVPVFDDFFGAARVPTFDMGAVNP
jgi:hypothetical protein